MSLNFSSICDLPFQELTSGEKAIETRDPLLISLILSPRLKPIAEKTSPSFSSDNFRCCCSFRLSSIGGFELFRWRKPVFGCRFLTDGILRTSIIHGLYLKIKFGRRLLNFGLRFQRSVFWWQFY